MSSPLAIAAVTVVLKDLLDNGMIDNDLTAAVGPVTVSALPPDRIEAMQQNPQSQINLFLYQVTPNQGWQNRELPSRNGRGDRITNPPLALDLHYLLTAYGAQDFHAEILLGYGMQLLHETPVLTRDAIRRALTPASLVTAAGGLPASLTSLSASGLADQYEQIRITPEAMGSEEMSKLWSAFQTHYRMTAAYRISVVLIESRAEVRSPLPVLTRGTGDIGAIVIPDLIPPYPTLLEIRPPNNQPAAYIGDTIRLVGHHLDGTGITVSFTHPRLDAPLQLSPAVPADATATEIALTIPNLPADWPAGIYAVQVALTQDGVERSTNVLAMGLAPRIVPPVGVATFADTTTITLNTTPQVRPDQSASLIIGDREVQAEAHPAPTSTLNFVADDLPDGTYRLRLRVDGVESILIDRTTTPPTFHADQTVTKP